MNFEKEIKPLWEVRKSDGLRDMKRALESGSTIKFIVVQDGTIVLGMGLHRGIAEENGIDYDDIYVEGQFDIKDDKLRWGVYWNVTENKGVIQEEIEKFLKANGINI